MLPKQLECLFDAKPTTIEAFYKHVRHLTKFTDDEIQTMMSVARSFQDADWKTIKNKTEVHRQKMANKICEHIQQAISSLTIKNVNLEMKNVNVKLQKVRDFTAKILLTFDWSLSYGSLHFSSGRRSMREFHFVPLSEGKELERCIRTICNIVKSAITTEIVYDLRNRFLSDQLDEEVNICLQSCELLIKHMKQKNHTDVMRHLEQLCYRFFKHMTDYSGKIASASKFNKLATFLKMERLYEDADYVIFQLLPYSTHSRVVVKKVDKRHFLWCDLEEAKPALKRAELFLQLQK